MLISLPVTRYSKGEIDDSLARCSDKLRELYKKYELHPDWVAHAVLKMRLETVEIWLSLGSCPREARESLARLFFWIGRTMRICR